MSDKNETSDKNQDQATIDAAPRQRTNILKPVFYIILLALVLSPSAYLYYRITGLNDQSISNNESSSLLLKGTALQIQKLENRINEQQSKIGELTNSISESLQQQPVSNVDWALAEVEFLLVIASQHLQLDHSTDTARQAMSAALTRLQAIHAPDIDMVKNQLQSDMTRLEQVKTVDTAGLSLYLSDLANRSSELPLKSADLRDLAAKDKKETSKTITESGYWHKAFSRVWTAIKGLVVIRRADEINGTILLPDERDLILKNLQIQLESARISVLVRDNRNFHASIQTVNDWLNKYFDTSQPAVANIRETLDKMATLDLSPDMPDISSSLETVKAYIQDH